ncbi:MAG: DUF2341 domain-containing protein, partial [Syntrophobacterales bacterium]
MKPRRNIAFLVFALIFAWLFIGFPQIAEVQEAQADTYSVPVNSINPGWSYHRKRVVFHNGNRFFLLYSKGGSDANIYYQSSMDNVSWSGEATLNGIGASSVFDIYLVNDTKFDLVYKSGSNAHSAATCTISDATITCGSPSANWLTAVASPELVVARSGTGDRIYVATGAGDRLRIYSADQTGDAQNVTSWTEEHNGKDSPEDIAMVPYQGSDQVLLICSEFKFDRVYAYVVTRGSGAANTQCVGFASTPDISSPVSLSDLDNDFRFIILQPSGAMEEWKWDGSSCTQVDANIDPDNETDHSSPSLFYDRISGDMYAFSMDYNVERHYKPSGGSWQTEVDADGDTGVGFYSNPITQMHDPPYGSSRTWSALVWAFRVESGTEYNLKVGTLTFAPRISSDANQVFSVGQAATTASQITVTEADTPSITAANGLRIRIADGVDMVWDTSASPTYGGTYSGSVISTSYEDNDRVLVIDVDADFAAGETLTINDAAFKTFGSVNSPVSGLQLLRDGPSDTVVDGADDKTIAIGGAVTLADHSAGQVTDKFTGQTESETTTEYFQFQLDNDGESASTTLTVDLSSISGIFTGDVTNAELWADSTGDGLVTAATAWSSYSTTEFDVYALTFDSTHNVLYAGTASSGIILRCETSTGCDEITDWTTGYDTSQSQIRSLFFDSERNVIYAGSGSVGKIYRCDTGANTCIAGDGWTESFDPSSSNVYSFALDQINNVIYASATHIYRCDTSSGCDQTGDWTIAYNTSGLQVYSLTFDSTNSAILGGNSSSSIYRCDTSANSCIGGDGWGSYDPPGSNIWTFGQDQVNNVIYAGTSSVGAIIRCDTSTGCDAAGDWTTAYDTPETAIYSFTFDSINNVLYAGSNPNGLIYSCDTSTGCDVSGEWTTSYDDATAASIFALTFDSTNNVIYGGTSQGDIVRKFEGDYKVFDGVTNIAGASGTIAFNPATTLPAGTMDYLLRATISNIADGDTITFDLSPSGVVATGEVSGESLTVSDSSTDPLASITHTRGAALNIFGFRKSITIDRTKISDGSCGTTLSNFPMLFSVTDGDLKTTANGGDVASYDAPSNDPRDIIFRALDDDTCSPGTAPCGLYHEIEDYDPATGELVAWVNIPSVNTNAASSDTVIYIYYGNSDVTSSTQNANAVWDTNYAAVWHLSESPDDGVAGHVDSTGNNTAATPQNFQDGGGGTTDATGKIGGADSFAGDDDEVLLPNELIGGSTQWTMSAWIQTTSTAKQTIYGEGSSSTTNYLYIDKEADSYVAWYLENAPEAWPYFSGDVNVEGTEFHHITIVQSATDNRALFVDGDLDQGNPDPSGTPSHDTASIGLLRTRDWTADPFNGIIDEVRISNTNRNTCWIKAEYNNQAWPDKAVTPTPDPSPNPDSGFYTLGVEEPNPATAVDLVSFTAKGQSSSVLVEWETAQELDHMGFYLYRARSPWGPYTRLTDKLISNLTSSVVGRKYSYEDKNVTPGEIYYYRLEDIDIYGKKTLHGPICVDWDGDGLPDDWEIAQGLNPGFADADLDWDGDGLTNLEEYLHGTDPFNPDTDGDGILDGDEEIERDPHEENLAGSLSPGVYIVASDDAGITLELRTDSFDFTVVQAEGQEFERLRIKEYIHGFTSEVGKPELPLKGILLDIPEGNAATLTVLETEDEIHSGYRVYPVPEKTLD